MSMKEKLIGGISLSVWKNAFADAVAIAIDKDYFSDTLFFDLDFSNETEKDIEYAWKCVEEAFEEVFGSKLRGC